MTEQLPQLVERCSQKRVQDRIFGARNFARIYQFDESVVANGTVTPDLMRCDE